ncbi:MAG: hypothetical protein ABIK37_04915 [candidate division WOR-3 bacterium]
MKAAFPYMGTVHMVLEPIMRELGSKVIVPPSPTDETVATGARLAPEAMCLPFKITLGNMVYCLKAGADTLIYTTGSWSCRFGYYGRMQADILRDLGYRFDLLELSHENLRNTVRAVLKLSSGSLPRALGRVSRAFRIGWLKSIALERAEEVARKTMPFARSPDTCWALLKNITQDVKCAQRPTDLIRIRGEIDSRFGAIKRNGRGRPLRVKLVGESYCTLEPFVNFDIVRRLGEMGVLVDPFLTTHRWLGLHGFRLGKDDMAAARAAATKYWRYCCGGEDANSLGHMLRAVELGYDGVIHLSPFACMPSTVVEPAMVRVSIDRGIPFLSFSLDEHSSETGVLTRLEAFVSLLERQRRANLTRCHNRL